MRPLKEKISVSVDSDLLEKARLVAEEDDRSLSNLINIALRAYLRQKEAERDEENTRDA